MEISVVIVIPVYKSQLNEYEKISLKQVRCVLGDYQLVFVAPQSLEFQYGELGKGIRIERWPDKYFKNNRTYGNLIMSEEFYERFIKYEYLFIYQLDGFVFSDKLKMFCSMGFDYIGAPIPRSCWPPMPGYVGNGGVSLRRVKSMLNLLKNHDAFSVLEAVSGDMYSGAEDIFFSYWGGTGEIKIPSVGIAAEFALDQDVQHRLRTMTEAKLPFACHAWQKANFPVWRRFIEARGYNLEAISSRDIAQLSLRHKCIISYISRRMFSREKVNVKRLKKITKHALPRSEYAFWGYGQCGRRTLKWFLSAGVPVHLVYDKNIEKDRTDENGVTFRQPCKGELIKRKMPVIVTSPKYEVEVVAELESMGLFRGWDFYTYDEVFKNLALAYMQSFKD